MPFDHPHTAKPSLICEPADDDGYGECRLCDYYDRLDRGLCPDCAEQEEAEAYDTSDAAMRREHGTWSA